MLTSTDVTEFFDNILISYFIGLKSGLIRQESNGDIHTLQQNSNFEFLVQLVDKMNRIINLNSIPNIFLMNKEFESEVISKAIVPAFSFFNHSCIETTHITIHGDYMVLRSLCPIKKDKQIFITRSGLSYRTKDRRAKLLHQNIDCKCKACVDNWMFPIPKTQSTKDNNQDLKQINNSFAACAKTIQSLTKKRNNDNIENNELLDLSKYMDHYLKLVNDCHNVLSLKSCEINDSQRQLMKLILLTQMPGINFK